MVSVIVLGLPGSGKSTQSTMIANYYSVPAISAGRLLREAVRNGTEAGRKVEEYLQRGELAPNHIVDELVFDRFSQPDTQQGFVLDGFPRTIEQAHSLDEFLRQTGKRIEAVLYLDVPNSVIVARLGARRICPVCGAAYNLVYRKPSPGEICYACHTPIEYHGGGLIECEGCKKPFELREDDRPDVVDRRLHIQQRAIKPVLGYYRGIGLLTVIVAARLPEEVFEEIRTVLGKQQRQAGGI